jgi:UDP-galactopyranose mutase
MFDWLVVGAGFAGSVLAERLASQRGEKVLIIDKRNHIGGNAYDRHDASGVLIHQYGPHIFHTNAQAIVDYLSQFTSWRPYEHRVLAEVDGRLLPIPINRTTLNELYGLSLSSDEEVEAFLASRAEPVDEIRSSEDVVVNRVGRELYEKFFRGYTRKQWGVDPSELDKSVTARVPTRTNTDDRYFTDTFQAMPAEGYTRMFERMLDHPNIKIMLQTSMQEVIETIPFRRMIYTGPIDEFFNYRYGKLPYRSLRFEHATLDQEWRQPVAVVNYPQDQPYTRITEYKHLTGQSHRKTSITYEYPSDQGDPYYPVPRAENQALFKRYEALAEAMPHVTFVGRLATYRYYNMDQVVGQALATFRRIGERIRTAPVLVGGAVSHADERPHAGTLVGAVKSPLSSPPLTVMPSRRRQAKPPGGPRLNGAAPTHSG